MSGSVSLTKSLTTSITASLRAISNFTSEVSPATTLWEGQEFRVRVAAVVDGGSFERTPRTFNVSDEGEFEMRLFAYVAALHDRCLDYATSPSISALATRTKYGLSDDDRTHRAHYVNSAYSTFVAPSAATPFIICFKHTVDAALYTPQSSEANGVWQNVPHSSGPIWNTAPTELWYYLPEATVGQYAVMQLLSDQRGFNFSYAPSSCSTDLKQCVAGDNVKVVPSGVPCTYEYQDHDKDYYGSSFVHANGVWVVAGVDGLVEGATAGGVGVFGTQYANPLVDGWSSSGTYHTLWNATAGKTEAEAYVYLRLPQVEGGYDVCFSSLEGRAVLSNGTNSSASQPVWRKLYRCTTPEACSAVQTSFVTTPETIGWSMADVTPHSWGEIIFSDGDATLNTFPASRTTVLEGVSVVPRNAETWNYWSPPGGDMFRIVPVALFAEVVSDGRAVQYGSQPMAGCWSRDLDVASGTSSSGFIDEEALYPIGAKDLRGDPTQNATDDIAGVATAAATLHVPGAGTSWHVCYRRTCTFSSTSCVPHSGMRVLPFHKGTRGALPHRWTHLNDSYTPGNTATPAHTLSPGEVLPNNVTKHDGYPSGVTWYMNDTRAGTWGPLIVEKWNTTAGVSLDSRKWNFARNYTGYDTVGMTVGSAVRLVPKGKPCDYPGYTTQHNAESMDGGMVECNDARSATDTTTCPGSAADHASISNVAYYITVPEIADYTVCHRLHWRNWVALPPSTSGRQWDDPTYPTGYPLLRRSEWTTPAYFTPTEPALTTLSFTAVEQRSGMQALFLIEDSTSGLQIAGRDNSSSGDVLRMIDTNGSCDVTPMRWGVEGRMADTHLSLICNVSGSGSPQQSGLYDNPMATQPCAQAKPTLVLCGGAPCNATEPHLLALTATTPDIYDDIVPHDHIFTGGVSVSAAVITLPPPGSYKLCFKHAGRSNWAIFNQTWEVLPAHSMRMLSPIAHKDILLGGELRQFRVFVDTLRLITTTNGSYEADFTLFAKLIPIGAEQNQGCHIEAAGTEGGIGSAATTAFSVVDQNTLYFYLTAPHTPGNYSLCIQLRQANEDTMSWWSPLEASGGYTVIDNQVRWYVTEGAQPTNQGLSVINFARCKRVTPDALCSTAASNDVLTTGRHGDMAKIINTNSSCHNGSTVLSPWGSSVHRGSGLGFLGPGDGPIDVAQLRTVLPATENDIPVEYKVCLRTVFYREGVGRVRWVEVAQGENITSQYIVRSATGKLGFRTEPARMRAFVVDPAIRPAYSLYSAEAKGDATILAGVSTAFVSNPTSATDGSIAQGSGFSFVSYAAGMALGNQFKLVLVRSPVGRLPNAGYETSWGTVANWTALDADCLSPGVEATAQNVGSCADNITTDVYGQAFCPHIRSGSTVNSITTVPAYLQVPLDPGSYLVCYRAVHFNNTSARPWLVLSSALEGDGYLHVHPSYLEVSVSSTQTNASAYDMRTTQHNNEPLSLSSWCGAAEGVDCTALNGAAGFTADLITLANDTTVCPIPNQVGPGGDWFQLTWVSNFSSGVADGSAFALPPAGGTASRYKLCVYKAGEGQGFSSAGKLVSRPGVVYQLYNRGDVSQGGGGGYWHDAGTGLQLTLAASSTLSYNASTHFTQYSPTLSAQYTTIPTSTLTSPITGQLSRTPLLPSGSIVDYTIEVTTTDGVAVPIGDYTVEVQRCFVVDTWTGLECILYDDPTVSGVFAVWNVGGGCVTPNLYGWAENRLWGFMRSGVARMSLQYRSVCHGEFGCGIRFAVKTTSGTLLLSPAQWVHIAEQYPDGLLIDSIDTTKLPCTVSSPTTCYQKPCTHGLPCTITFQALRLSQPEYAANGTIYLSFANSATIPAEVAMMFGASISLLAEPKPWGRGGEYTHSFTPMLSSGDHGVVYLNASYGTTWTYFAVSVTKPVPTKFFLASVRPVLSIPAHLAVDRTPSPAVFTSTPSQALAAKGGSYLEALSPYIMTYIPKTEKGVNIEKVPRALQGWTITAVVEESVVDRVLHNDAPDLAFTTEPGLLERSGLKEVLGEVTTFTVVFRVYIVDNVCSRFGGKGGCTLVFTFAKTGFTTTATFTTPIRIPASTLQVTTSAVVASVREGIVVTARPGSYVVPPTDTVPTFVYDEFHAGDVFAMVDPFRPLMVPDANRVRGCVYPGDLPGSCLVESYPAQIIAGTTWGAQWTLRPHTPCNRCTFTFHTSWGAGPESYELFDDGSQRGTAVLTFSGEDVTLQCLDSVVGFPEGGTSSAGFVVTVTAASVSGVSVVYPQWRVVSGDLIGNGSVALGAPLAAPMVEGVATFVAVLVGSAPTVRTIATLPFTAVGFRYLSGPAYPEGTQPVSSEMFRCNSTLVVVPEPASTARTTARVSSTTATTASTVCPACIDIHLSTDEFAAGGITFDATFENITSNGAVIADTTPRNATIVPTGIRSSPWQQGVTWTKGTTWTSQDIVLDSTYDDMQTIGAYTYAHGSVDVVATRGEVMDGKVQTTLAYRTTHKTPVRHAAFHLCGSQWDHKNNREQYETSLCVLINLWVTANPADRKTTFTQEHTTQNLIHGAPSPCGAGQIVQFSLASYYLIAGSEERQWAYETQLTYSLTVQNGAARQYIVEEGKAPSLGAVRVDAGGAPQGVLSAGLIVHFAFYVRDAVSSCDIRTTVTSSTSSITTYATSSTQYTWSTPVETYATWAVHSRVTLDDDCTSQRRLQTTTQNYRTYGTSPGLGWSYLNGVSVGVPFPIETVVLNGNGGRAFTFTDGVFVRVTKQSWSGCNDGGALKVYQLRRGGLGTILRGMGAYMAGDVTLSAVTTNGGAAIAWNILTAECEKCTLQLDLCFSGNTAQTCMEINGKRASDRNPIFADRTKLTRPFSVRKPRMDAMQVYSQTLPGPTIYVGELFRVGVENVQRFASKWAVSETAVVGQWQRAMWVRTVLAVDSAATYMRYGHGGFLHDGASRASHPAGERIGCHAFIGPTEYAASTPKARLVVSPSGLLQFFFIRPCSRCEVWFDYILTPPTGTIAPIVYGSFPLREYTDKPGMVFAFKVQTCSTKWVLSGVPAAAVRKRRPFSLTALRTDGFNFASLEGSGVYPFGSLTGLGNGAGSAVSVTSPLFGNNNPISVVNGSSTIRAYITRACYQCRLTFITPRILTVLTDATQLIVVPHYNSSLQHLTPNHTLGVWNFIAYAADDMGDRAYTVGGITEFSSQHLYQTRAQYKRPAALLTIKASTPKQPQAVLNSTKYTLGTLLFAKGGPQITQGSNMYNGIPTPAVEHGKTGGPGDVSVELSGVAVQMGLSFAVPGLPDATRLLGDVNHPMVHLSVEALLIALDDPAKASGQSCTTTIRQGTPPCTFNAYTIGHPPGVLPEDATWYVAVKESAVSQASVQCGPISAICATAEVTPQASYHLGVASFRLTFIKFTAGHTGGCDCRVTVKPPDSLPEASSQGFTVTYSATDLSQWRWESSGSVDVVGGATYSARERLVELRLVAMDGSASISGLGGLLWSSPRGLDIIPTEMTPEGCFACAGAFQGASGLICPVLALRDGSGQIRSDVIHINGTFPTSGTCTINAAALSGLPTTIGVSTTPATGLTITVSNPVGFVRSQNFTNLYGSSMLSTPAAITGVGTTVSYDVVDSLGQRVHGDNYMTFTMTANAWHGASYRTIVWTKRAKAGRATFHIDSNTTTRHVSCVPTNATLCAHHPWTFTVTASSPVYLSASVRKTEYIGSTQEGPLLFVRQATRLEAYTNITMPCVDRSGKYIPSGWMPLSLGRASCGANGEGTVVGPVQWLLGVQFSVKIVALGADGVQVTHPEDLGSAVAVHFHPLTVPCRAAERVLQTCVDGANMGECRTDLTPAVCTQPAGWAVSKHIFTLIDGQTFLKVSFIEHPNVIARFSLSTTEMGQPWNRNTDPHSLAHPDKSFLYEIRIAQAARIRPETTPSSPSWTCHTTGSIIPTDICVRSTPYTPGSNISLPVSLQDTLGSPTLHDSQSLLTITGHCTNPTASAYLTVNSTSGPDYFAAPKYSVTYGVTVLEGFYISGTCSAMTVNVACQGRCGGVGVTLQFAVVGATLPPAVVQTGSVSLGLPVASFASLAKVTEFIATFDAVTAEKQMMKMLSAKVPFVSKVLLVWVCYSGGTSISVADKASGNCTKVASRTADVMQASSGLFVITEFEVVAAVRATEGLSSAVTAAVVEDLQSSGSVLREAGANGSSPFATDLSANFWSSSGASLVSSAVSVGGGGGGGVTNAPPTAPPPTPHQVTAAPQPRTVPPQTVEPVTEPPTLAPVVLPGILGAEGMIPSAVLTAGLMVVALLL